MPRPLIAGRQGGYILGRMTATPTRYAPAAVGAASLALLLGALGFQYLGGLAPCPLCLWQRWPHGVVIALGVVGLAVAGRPTARAVVLGLAGLALTVGAGIALYHVGVEQAWWEGTTACTGGAASAGGDSVDALRQQLFETELVRCDAVAWSLLGISMAGWNGLISVAVAAFAFAAAASSLRERSR
ncbi:MAG: disulfide bond formation protein B [Azospirillaceae bacterium]